MFFCDYILQNLIYKKILLQNISLINININRCMRPFLRTNFTKFVIAGGIILAGGLAATVMAAQQSKNDDTAEKELSKQLEKIDISGGAPLLSEYTLEGVAKYISDGKAKNIIVLTGAGISTSAGIPDFRSPGTGLYDNLKEYNLPHPQAIFEISYFTKNPEPFYKLAKELFPGKLKPTPCHYFIRLLHEKGLLLRTYTQNIDTLEHVAGIPAEKIVEAHGTFHTSHCTHCNHEYDLNWMREHIMKDLVPRCSKCENVVKPDIIFFGEALPTRFFKMVSEDFKEKCDLLIIIGTSLVVQPFASLTERAGDHVPRLLINREKVELGDSMARIMRMMGLQEACAKEVSRDVFWQGSSDDGCEKLANLLGWGDELKKLIEESWNKIEEDAKNAGGNKAKDSQKKAADTPREGESKI